MFTNLITRVDVSLILGWIQAMFGAGVSVAAAAAAGACRNR
jgi:hypothetical protein